MTPVNIILAESSPILNAGITACLRQLSQPQYNVIDAATPDALASLLADHPDAIVMVDPMFGGTFDPESLRGQAAAPVKIIAIETAPLPRTTRSLYDAVLPINEDLDGISHRIAELNAPETAVTEDKEALTQREKEIIINVVKGLTNKEIAAKLFLSVHTVLTHRRNIARKLEIHSATGLTIYAIVNGLVDLSEIKI